MITARFFEILREDQCTCVEGSASVLKDLYLATASAHRGLCSLEKVRYSSTMPPKGADQNKANGISLKKAQQLPTLQPLALGGSSAHHAPLHHEADNSNMDQDPADRLQAGLMDFLGADEDGDGDDQQDFQTLVGVDAGHEHCLCAFKACGGYAAALLAHTVYAERDRHDMNSAGMCFCTFLILHAIAALLHNTVAA